MQQAVFEELLKRFSAAAEAGDGEAFAQSFTPDGVTRLAEIACAVNEKTENIGARRLYTVMERLLEEISFDAGSGQRRELRVDAAYVDARLADLARNEDLARYVL
jgi:ATP-dependent HslUV protease ATP-binding subunit HslU